jgi:hypothetical protein
VVAVVMVGAEVMVVADEITDKVHYSPFLLAVEVVEDHHLRYQKSSSSWSWSWKTRSNQVDLLQCLLHHLHCNPSSES